MTKNKLSKWLTHLACLLVVTQALIVGLVATIFFTDNLNQAFIHAFRHHQATAITLLNVPEQSEEETWHFLQRQAEEQSLFYARTDLMKDDQTTSRYDMGIYGNISAVKSTLPITFLGQTVVDTNHLETLLINNNKQKIWGIETSSLNSFGELPHFRFFSSFIIKPLPQMISDQKNINGEYLIVGLDDTNKETFLEELSQSARVPRESLTEAKWGYETFPSLFEIVLPIMLVVHTIIFIFVCISLSVQYLPEMGKLILLGWSKWTIIRRIFAPIVCVLCGTCLLMPLYGLWLGEFSFINTTYLFAWLIVAVCHLFITMSIIVMGSIVLWVIQPIQAIHNRYPKRFYLASAMAIYVIGSLLLVWACYALDGPIKEVSDYQQVKKLWGEHKNYQVLSEMEEGLDQASMRFQSNKLREDFYHWYQSIEGKDGVYIIYSDHIDEDKLARAQFLDGEPYYGSRPYWQMTFSPNYLKQIGIDIDEDRIKQAQLGVRTYLIPDTYPVEERQAFESLLKKQDEQALENQRIKTHFNQDPRYQFITYASKEPIFTWSTDLKQAMEVNDPIISVLTTNNMLDTEIESLSANGFNCPVKLTEHTKEKYANQNYFANYQLDDNRPAFLTVKHHIDGIQKTLKRTLTLFGINFALIVAVTLLLLFTLITIYQMTYEEVIYVKRFMGYPFYKIYQSTYWLLIIVNIICFALSIYLRSRIAYLIIPLIFIIEISLLYKMIRSITFKHMLTYFNER